MALNQVVLPGFAAYRIGTGTSKSDAAIQSGDDAGEDTPDDEATPEDEDAPPRG
jgi:hypothetical protein